MPGRIRRTWWADYALLALPLILIGAIVTADVLSPQDIHLGPLLIVAPAITASFARPRVIAVISVVTVMALVAIGLLRGVLATQNVESQLGAVVVISTVVTVFSIVRERRGRELAEVRTVSEAAQRALLRPLPRRIGPLRVASMYLAAQDQAQIGGDLYAAVRTTAGTRIIIGDVMGKGLTAISDSALLLGAFREAAHRQSTLRELVSYLEASVCWNMTEPTEQERDGEIFITALVLDIPDNSWTAQMAVCGHPPPLLLHNHRVTELYVAPAFPLGLCLTTPNPDVCEFRLEPGDVLVLYTDGVTEARNTNGAFYPLADRMGAWTPHHSPQALIHHLRNDLLSYAGGRLADDAAVIALQRTA
ncbi:serine/threonine-protein phosphatase [Streptomyces sp. RB6PN25]|uniref:Serine/threonine-protein phosphatase n=1 Tax=Streptomyces humicola TaxID=2953240 RepID=A0ABT1PNA4_9ACTN|nr:PP2C family protein-serine/threonine phosphatase [Streptomyces humicola]MCQ4079149.1 serine/threonine-protein phosphatase [Streptomyces humicola]